MNVVSQDSEPVWSKSGQRQDTLIRFQPWILSYKLMCLGAILSVTGANYSCSSWFKMGNADLSIYTFYTAVCGDVSSQGSAFL